MPQPATHNLESKWITTRRSRLSFVGNLSRSKRQANNTTLRGTSLCQIEEASSGSAVGGWRVRKLYRLRTLKAFEFSKVHSHLSSLVTCSVTLTSNKMSSPTISSSQTNNLRLHRQASPPSPHPNCDISYTDSPLRTDKSNNLLNLTLKDTPPHHTSDQNRVFLPFST